MAGVLTRTQIENEALDNIAKSGVLTLQSGTTLGTRMTNWVNRAHLKICRRTDLLQYTATTTTVKGQQNYAFPDNIRRVYSIKFEDGLNSRKLTCMMPWEFDRKVPMPSAITQLRSWYYIPYKQTGQFELFPIPDGVYTLRMRYSLFPSDFTSATAVSAYTNLDDAIVAYATMFGFRWLQELKDAEEWLKIGNAVVDAENETQSDDNNFIDWEPQSEGFTTQDTDFTGQYYNNPFIRDNNLTTWWR
jgi:hypothetical protein